MDGRADGVSMGRQRVLAVVQQIKMNDDLAAAVLVSLGTFFMLLCFTFYPLFLIPVLSIATGIAAYKKPALGTILGMVIAFPAVAYQAPVLAWVFTIVLGITLFEAFEHWSTISFLQIAIMAPFAIFPFSLLSGFLFLFLGVAAQRFGSAHSFVVSLPAIFVVLLLSTIWLYPTSSFITISNGYESLYGPEMSELQNQGKPAVDIVDLVSATANSFASLLNFDTTIRPVSEALEKISGNVIILLTRDFALVQLASWAIALFLCAYLPAHIDNKNKQALAALALFIVPVVNLMLAPAFNNPVEPLSFAYCAASVGIIAFIESKGIRLSLEKQAVRREKQKAFGKFGLQDLADSEGATSLGDIGGYEDVKTELREAIITPLKQADIAYTYGIKPPNGILLFGPPGTGKTLLMRALAKETDIGFYYVKCSDLISSFQGESEKNISEVFTIARKKAPCVLFFDEIDSIGRKRDSYVSDDYSPKILSTLLEEMDGFKGKKSVICIGATNMPDRLDPALTRPGRFDKIIYMHLPDFDARKAIFQVHLRSLPLEQDMDYAELAKKTERYSGADIKNICTEASRLAARAAVSANVVVNISMEHVLATIKRFKPSVTLDQLELYNKFRMDYERRSDAEDKKPEAKGVRWSDVAGLEDVRQNLLEAIELPLLHEKDMADMDIKPSKGMLLFGPPGCGKTMIVKAAANELNANFLTITGSELMGGREKNPSGYVKEIFNRARESAPALVFIDEVEALAPSRDEYHGGILTELLQELDGVKELKNVMIIGATNKPSALDSAILRPGRFDKIIYIPPPDEPARKQLFSSNLSKFLKGVDVLILARASDGYSGADIASICQKVKMEALRDKLKGKQIPLTTQDVLNVIKTRRPSITAKDLREYDAFRDEYGERK